MSELIKDIEMFELFYMETMDSEVNMLYHNAKDGFYIDLKTKENTDEHIFTKEEIEDAVGEDFARHATKV